MSQPNHSFDIVSYPEPKDQPWLYSQRFSPKSSPRKPKVRPPVPPLPEVMAPSTPISRSSSGSSASSHDIITPSPRRSRSSSSGRLLPAFPLVIDTSTPSPHRKLKVVNSTQDDVQTVITKQDNERCQKPRRKSTPPSSPRWSRTPSPPPRPARRLTSPKYPSSLRAAPLPPAELLPPRPTFRATSPSDSVSTISPATTPKPIPSEKRDLVFPMSNLNVSMETPMRKRDSAQRRLSALRGLVGSLDFGQPWSNSTPPGVNDVEEEGCFWACAEPMIDESPKGTVNAVRYADRIRPGGSVDNGVSLLDGQMEAREMGEPSIIVTESNDDIPEKPVERERSRSDAGLTTKEPIMLARRRNTEVSQDHGWPEARSSDTPARLNPARKASTTPSLRARRSALSNTPEPPRPASRQRQETFQVATAGYSKSLAMAPPSPSLPGTTWRSSLSSEAVYVQIVQQYGPLEAKRQEVLWEMSDTEHSFVKSMRTVLRLFAIPLKTPQGKWIEGIPDPITDLFDNLETVAHAHGILSATQRDQRRKTERVDVGAFVGMFKSWVTRLNHHEAYLLRFEGVVKLVEENVRDKESVFGEFVRMQMKEEVLGSMSLGSMLLKPVQRLTKYPLFLKRLLDVTPHPHPSHPDIMSLLSQTESIILVLQATKAREEDYEQLLDIESRLSGLPEEFSLAKRGRKFIGQGQVVKIAPPASPLASPRTRAGSFHSSRGSISSSVSSSVASSSPWDFTLVTPTTCRSSAFSIGSSSSFSGPSRQNSLSSQTPQKRPSVTRSPSSASSLADSTRPVTPGSSRSLRRKEEGLTLMVFDDLVLLATGAQEKGLFKKKGEKMKVIDEGIGEVIDVKDWSGWGGYTTLIALTILPPRALHTNTICFTITPNSPTTPSKQHYAGNSPRLTTVAQFMTTLTQACTAGTAAQSEGSLDMREVLSNVSEDELDSEEEGRFGFSEVLLRKSLGVAQ